MQKSAKILTSWHYFLAGCRGTIAAEDGVQTTINELMNNPKKQSFGLLIGQLTKNRDYIVHIVQTPIEDDDDDDSQDLSTKLPSEPRKYTLRMDAISEKWVAIHAKQVRRMLPGGLDIIGVYGAAPSNVIVGAQTKMRQVLYSIFKTIYRNNMIPPSEDDISDRIMLHICQTTKKVLCKTYDISDIKCSPRPAELKYQSFMDKWSLLETRVAIKFPFMVPKEMSGKSFPHHVQSGLKVFCRNVYRSIGTIDGILREMDEPLENVRSGKSKAPQGETHCVSLFLQPDDTSYVEKQCPAEAIIKKLQVRGTIHARAFVHSKATVQEALMVLKADIIQGLKSRCELLYEDFLEAKEDDTESNAMETPVRVFVNIPKSRLCFCDYMFPDEKGKDVVDRFSEILGLSVTEGDLDLSLERLPAPADLADELDGHELLEVADKKRSMKSRILVYVVSGAVGAVAIGFSYMYLGGKSYYS